MKAKSKTTTETADPAMKRGFKPVAPYEERQNYELNASKKPYNVRDVGDRLTFGHGHTRVERLALGEPDYHHGK